MPENTQLKEALEQGFKDTLGPILSAISDPVQHQFYAELAQDAAEAILLGREDLIEEIKGQARVRGERLRIDAGERVWTNIRNIVGLVVRTGMAAIAAQATAGLGELGMSMEEFE